MLRSTVSIHCVLCSEACLPWSSAIACLPPRRALLVQCAIVLSFTMESAPPRFSTSAQGGYLFPGVLKPMTATNPQPPERPGGMRAATDAIP